MYLSVMDLCTQMTSLYSICTPQAGNVWYDGESRRCTSYLGQCCIYVENFSMGGGVKTDIPQNVWGVAWKLNALMYMRDIKKGGEI